MKKIIAIVLSCLLSIAAFAQQGEPLKVAWTIYPSWQLIALTNMKLQGKGNPSFLEKRTVK